MDDPFNLKNNHSVKKLARARLVSAFSMIFERISAQGWRSITWILLFCGLWLFEIPGYFGDGFGIAAFFVFLLGLVYFHYSDLRFFKFPGLREIDHRVETESGFEHRPITALNDDLANPLKTDSRSLWRRNKERALELLAKARPAFPRSMLPAKDPYALRLGVLMFFGIGVLLAGPDSPARIWRGLTPFESFKTEKTGNIRLVITPPTYTGISPLVLDEKNKGANFEIPSESILKAAVHGGLGHPFLKTDEKSFPLKYAGGGNYTLEMPVPMGHSLKITRLFIPRASWSYNLIPDALPEITVKEPEILPEGGLRFPVSVKDDYGVKTLTMRMELGDISIPSHLGKAASETRSVMSPPKTPLDLQPVYDLTAHPWAGLPVKFVFEAEDGKGQKTVSEFIKMTLPERSFTHPVARQLVALRKKLLVNPLSDYEVIRTSLERILLRPNDFQRDTVVTLALRSASSRLYWADRSETTAGEVAALLWDTALSLQDGDFSIAARNLRDAQGALENALKNPNLSDEEIAKLMQNLRQAMAQYFTELSREIQKRVAEGKQIPMIPSEMLSKMIDPESLAAMLNQMEAQMRSGDKDAAQKMLSQLQNMMDMMNPSATPLPPDMQAMMKSMKALQELIEGQQALLDKTKEQTNVKDNAGEITRNYGEAIPKNQELMKRWGLDDMPPPPKVDPGKPSGLVDTKPGHDEQESLRRKLGDVMMDTAEALNQIPENLTQAEQEMRESSKALGASDPGISLSHQEKVLEYLKQGQQEMSQQFMARLQQMTGLAMGGGGQYDPLGRPYGGNGDQGLFPGSTVKIPDEAQRKQAQEILRLLQKRSGELGRPEEELDYYRRLLRQF